MRLLLLIMFTWVLSCQPEKTTSDLGPPVNPPEILNVAFIIVDGVYNTELTAPFDVFHHTVFHTQHGMRVFTLAPEQDTIRTFEGITLFPDYSFPSTDLPKIDILVVPSAKHSMDSDLENAELIEFIRKAGQEATYVMSLCDGAFVLAKAGLLDTYLCTTFPSDVPRLKQQFPQLKVEENVSFVHDRKFLTSAGGAKSFEVALYLTELLYGKTVANRIADGLVIDWDLSKVLHLRN